MQLAVDRNTGQHVAVKFLARNGPEFEARTIARELVNHKMCALHPHIVQLQVRSHCLCPCTIFTAADGSRCRADNDADRIAHLYAWAWLMPTPFWRSLHVT